MNPVVKKDILNTLRQAEYIIKENQVYRLREISDHVIKTASIFQDKESIQIAVIIYAISKIYSSKKKIDSYIVSHIHRAISDLESGDLNKYDNEIKSLLKDLTKNSQKTKFYIEEVLERAQIKKASKMFELGISAGQVADALDVSVWDIMDYIGKTRIIDESGYKTDVISKLEFSKQIFGVK